MQRPSLAFALTAVLFTLPEAALAAEPGAGSTAADPFAPAPEAKDPSVEEQEAAVLGTPNQPAPPATQAPPPAPTTPARRPTPRARRQAGDDAPATPAAPDQSGVAVELSTSGFASGSLTGGLFVGGRTAGGVILGGFLDYGLTSITTMPAGASTEGTTSAQATRVGFGARFPFVQSADRMVDLFGAIDISFDHRSAEVISQTGTMPTQSVSAAGLSAALGPGLRLWVHEHVALGYVGRLRAAYLSGEAGALFVPATDATVNATATAIGFDGTFQILGVF